MPSPTKTSNPSSQGRPQPGGSSFLSKFFRFIAPCAFPSPASHPIELPDFQPPQEKVPSKTPEHHVAEAQPAETSKPTTAPQEHEPQEAISVAPVGDFTEVVVPPTPTIPHLLPPEETEGMTSGAVQPPGSKGDTPVHEKAQHTPISENEDSEYTDEDPDELDDEEDRLIYSGGAGIPIGPVRRFFFCKSPSLSNFLPLLCRMEHLNPFFLQSLLIMLAENVLCLIWTRPLYIVVSGLAYFFLNQVLAQTTDLSHHSQYRKPIMSSQSKLNFSGITSMSSSDRASTIS